VVEINMIPLIDVALVVLIIFMVMTPILVQQQIKINLPHASSSTESSDRPIVITMQREGELSLNGRAVSASALESELKPLLGAEANRAVVIQADREVALQKVVTVMDVAKRLKVGKMGISVEQPK
jgi:biopolymer transport protein ExbD